MSKSRTCSARFLNSTLLRNKPRFQASRTPDTAHWPACPRRPGAARRGRPGVVAFGGGPGWRWAWGREVRELVLVLDAAAAGQQQWRALAREAALRGKAVARRGAAEPRRAGRHRPGRLEEAARRRLDARPLAVVVAQIAAMEAGELLALGRNLCPRRVPGEEPPAAAVAERIGQLDAAELRELVRRLQERLAAEA